jgi:HD-GYP domain-containing protein (c-di-GMP phosphodiesterase class II)
MKDHPAHGIRILEPIGFAPAIIDAIYQHHERYDGKGYPRGLAGEQITLAARILSVSDTMDAMLSERPYRGMISAEEVLAELERESGKQFDPKVSEAACRLIEKAGKPEKPFSSNPPVRKRRSMSLLGPSSVLQHDPADVTRECRR